MYSKTKILILLLTSFALVGANLLVHLAYAQVNQMGLNNTYNLSVGSKTFPIKYQIIGGKVNNITADVGKGSLLANISSKSNGNLTVELPRSVIDSKKPGGTDEQFIVLQDGQNSDFEEKTNNNQVRTLAISFDNGTNTIEIEGTKVLPIAQAPSTAQATSTNIILQGNKTTIISGAGTPSKTAQPSTAGPSKTTTTPSSSTTSSNNTYNLKIDNKTTIPIKYQISGNGNKLNSFTAQKDNATLLASISSQTDGKLTVELPRSVMDSKKQGNKDDDYVVSVDGQDASADEVKNNDQVRTLAINFDKGSQEISIIGTQIVPEFGNITIVTIILAIVIITIVVTSAKYNKGLSSFMQRR